MRGSGMRLTRNQGGFRRFPGLRTAVCAVLVGGAVAMPIGLGPLGLGSAGADSLGRSFVAVGEASGGYVRYGIPGFLVVENFLDGGGPVSRASLTSDGTSQAFGSLPYPGSAGATYNGTLALATGSAPPAYPFYVSAFYPTQPEQKMEDPSGAYRLSAAVSGEHADGQAVMAAPPQGDRPVSRASAASRGAVENGEVRAESTSLNEGFVAGPLSIGTLRSESVTRYRKDDAAPVTTTVFQLDGGRAGDLTFSFGSTGLQVAKQGVPIPVPSGISALNQALAPAGMSVRFVDPRPVPGGAAATAFEVVWTQKVPGAGDGTFFVRLGGASSLIDLGATEQEAASEPAGASGATESAAPTGAPSGLSSAGAVSGPIAGPESGPTSSQRPASPMLVRPGSSSGHERVAGHAESDDGVAPLPEGDSIGSIPSTDPAGAGAGRPEVAVRPVSERTATASASASALATVLLVGALVACALLGWAPLARKLRSWTA